MENDKKDPSVGLSTVGFIDLQPNVRSMPNRFDRFDVLRAV